MVGGFFLLAAAWTKSCRVMIRLTRVSIESSHLWANCRVVHCQESDNLCMHCWIGSHRRSLN